MSFSITPILSSYINKQGLSAIIFQVIYNNVKVYPEAGFKIKPSQWENGKVKDHVHKMQMNNNIKLRKNEIERILLGLHNQKINKQRLDLLISGKEIDVSTFEKFATSYMDEMRFKISKGRLSHYITMINKVNQFEPNIFLADMNGSWLQKFENHLHEKGLKTSTIYTNIKIIKAVLRVAERKGLIKTDFASYKNIQVISDEPEFLNEQELQSFFSVCRAIQKLNMKLAGYYFLLSCFTGFRLGDAKKFNYDTYIRNDEIIIRAQKNKNVVTIPLHTNLIEVLEYIRDKPLILSEDKIRKYVREIALLSGIKKHVKYHTSRHSWAMLLMSKGFTIDEIAKTIGDTTTVARIYAKVSNEQLSNKIKERLN